MKDSIVLVLSKVDTDSWAKESAVEEIQAILDKNKHFNDTTKCLLLNIIDKNNVYFFPHPDKINEDQNLN